MDYYRIIDVLDEGFERWHLGEPMDDRGQEVDARDFTQGVRVAVRSSLRVPQVCPGPPLDFTLAAFDMPVVRREVGELIEGLAGEDVQRIPARVEGRPGACEILNVARRVACIDESRTYVEWWTKADGRPDKVGQYRMIAELHVDPNRIGGSHLFRLTGWEIALICSGRMKQLLEANGVTGIAFRRV